MFPKYTKIENFEIAYFNKKELKLLEKEIFFNEIYEIELDNNTPEIIDAGAYLGLASIYFKKQYPNAKILAFEPNPNILPLLQENIAINNLKGIRIENYALGKKDSLRDFYIDSSGNNSFSTSGFIKNTWNGKQKTIPIEVRVTKLSEYINKDIDLLKMDIEGAEREVLEELRDSGKLNFIKNIIFEFHPSKKNTLDYLKSILIENEMKVSIREGLEGKDDPLVLVVGEKSPKYIGNFQSI